ncbi:hypothetical protein B0H14DRAFT_2603271 [Mycena olivaceomarginata]|nr:hypothetical protein B0H14DRAFT_2603271 [Mycena olivaceomarginata]
MGGSKNSRTFSGHPTPSERYGEPSPLSQCPQHSPLLAANKQTNHSNSGQAFSELSCSSTTTISSDPLSRFFWTSPCSLGLLRPEINTTTTVTTAAPRRNYPAETGPSGISKDVYTAVTERALAFPQASRLANQGSLDYRVTSSTRSRGRGWLNDTMYITFGHSPTRLDFDGGRGLGDGWTCPRVPLVVRPELEAKADQVRENSHFLAGASVIQESKDATCCRRDEQEHSNVSFDLHALGSALQTPNPPRPLHTTYTPSFGERPRPIGVRARHHLPTARSEYSGGTVQTSTSFLSPPLGVILNPARLRRIRTVAYRATAGSRDLKRLRLGLECEYQYERCGGRKIAGHQDDRGYFGTLTGVSVASARFHDIPQAIQGGDDIQDAIAQFKQGAAASAAGDAAAADPAASAAAPVASAVAPVVSAAPPSAGDADTAEEDPAAAASDESAIAAMYVIQIRERTYA